MFDRCIVDEGIRGVKTMCLLSGVCGDACLVWCVSLTDVFKRFSFVEEEEEERREDQAVWETLLYH